MSVRYEDAGVHLATSDVVTSRITDRLKNGLFGGFFPASALKAYDAPVLVSSIDGIGTKVRLASRLGKVGGLGLDLVHHCVNDIAVHGATPLFFLDYLAFHTLDPALVHSLVESIASACSALDVQLAGGETAEMPLVYPPGQFDVAGAIVGVVEQEAIVDGSAIEAGDVLIGLPSSGVHTNGFSLIQEVFDDDDYGRHEPGLDGTLGEALLQPHRCYLHQIRTLLAWGGVHGLAHITGGGIDGNLARIIPTGLQAVVSLPLRPPPLFALIEARGVPHDEMRRVFNMGIGMVAVCDRSLLSQCQSDYPIIGTIQPTTDIKRRVTYRDSA
ncbi:MAG: phosphoribosylformylglycinamidine cyclo-ligase [Chloroflexota bacterium]|nr:phosphoribosylformylglycinamidine cyclo-ligase [Chloroflexota bacterium]